ncbi:helicase MOV-10-like [Callospermophilus lateralis]
MVTRSFPAHRAQTHQEDPITYKGFVHKPPEPICGWADLQEAKLKLYDRSLESNPEHLQATKHIVMGTTRLAPYIIFGPPGTGKTITLVEAIKQVLTFSVSGSGSTCPAPSTASWPQAGTSTWYLRTLRLVSAQFPIDHFTHIFIDDAGHCMEPESLVAIARLMEVKEIGNSGGQLVLAGDPQQLGPLLWSPLTQKYGLGYSLLERLLTYNVLYKKGPDGYDPQFITKLLRNYRSHPTILDIPNQLYYDGELQACADVVD